MQPPRRLWAPPPVVLLPHDDSGDPDWGYMLQNQYARRGRPARFSRFDVPGQTLQHPRVMDANEAAEQFYGHPTPDNADAFYKSSSHVAGAGPAMTQGHPASQEWLDHIDKEHRFAYRMKHFFEAYKHPYMPPIQVALLRAIHDDPDDQGPHLAYADWVQEHGDPLAEKVAHSMRLQHTMADAVRSGKRLPPQLVKKWREVSQIVPPGHPFHGPLTLTVQEAEEARKRFALGMLHDPVRRAEQERQQRTGRRLRLRVPNPRMRQRPQSQPGPVQMRRPGVPRYFSREYIPLLHRSIADDPHDAAPWGQLADVMEEHGGAPAFAHLLRHNFANGTRRVMDLPGNQQVKFVHSDPEGHTARDMGDATELELHGHVHGVPVTVVPRTSYGRGFHSGRMHDSYAVVVHHPGTTNMGRMLGNTWVGRKHAAALLQELRPIHGDGMGAERLDLWRKYLDKIKDRRDPDSWFSGSDRMWPRRRLRLANAHVYPLDAEFLEARRNRRMVRDQAPEPGPNQMRRPGRPGLYAHFPFLHDPEPDRQEGFVGPPAVRDWRELTPTRKGKRRFLNMDEGRVSHRLQPPREDIRWNAFMEQQNQVARGMPAVTDWNHMQDPNDHARLLEMHQRFFPSGELGPKEYHKLFGELPGVKARPRPMSWGDEVYVNGEHPDVNHWTVGLRTHPDGRVVMHHHGVFFKPRVQGSGLGTRAFRNQVEQAARLGLDGMTLLAGKGGPLGNKMNGYYTWPLLGFNAYLPASFKRKLSELGGQADTVGDVMLTRPGRELWKRHGSMMDMAFDLTPGSHSMTALNDYLQAKGHPPVQLTPEELRRAEGFRQARRQLARSHLVQHAVNRDQAFLASEQVRLRDHFVRLMGMHPDHFAGLWNAATVRARDEHQAAMQEHQRRWPLQNAKLSVLGLGHRVARHFTDLAHQFTERQALLAGRQPPADLTTLVGRQRAQKATAQSIGDKPGWSAGKRS